MNDFKRNLLWKKAVRLHELSSYAVRVSDFDENAADHRQLRLAFSQLSAVCRAIHKETAKLLRIAAFWGRGNNS